MLPWNGRLTKVRDIHEILNFGVWCGGGDGWVAGSESFIGATAASPKPVGEPWCARVWRACIPPCVVPPIFRNAHTHTHMSHHTRHAPSPAPCPRCGSVHPPPTIAFPSPAPLTRCIERGRARAESAYGDRRANATRRRWPCEGPRGRFKNRPRGSATGGPATRFWSASALANTRRDRRPFCPQNAVGFLAVVGGGGCSIVQQS